jgi:transposase
MADHFSAEPCRTASYSSDLRWRIVWLRFGAELSIKSIARRLQVGVGTVHRILKRFESTGNVQPTDQATRYRKLDDLHELYS